jgi:hypothetical protein
MPADTYHMHAASNADEVLIPQGWVDITPETATTNLYSAVLLIDRDVFHGTHIYD